MGKRTKARECAFQMLYLWDRTREPMERVANGFWRVRTTTDETRARSEELARGAHALVEELDAVVASKATHWRLDRIAAVDLCILRLAVYELTREPHTPAAVVIDEAVELAKRFGDAGSPAFVNGVLDAIRRTVAGESGGAPRRRPNDASKRHGSVAPHRAPGDAGETVGETAGEDAAPADARRRPRRKAEA
jgi:N utilization substance protein B